MSLKLIKHHIFSLFRSRSASSGEPNCQQLLPVMGIVNARDIGGYTVQGGLCVRKGLLIRSAHLAEASDPDLQYLSDMGVVKIIDFRMKEEKKGKMDGKVSGVEYIDFPTNASGAVLATATEEEKKKFAGRKIFDIRKIIVMAAFNEKAKIVAREMYPTLFNYPDCQKQMAAFLQEVVHTESGAIVFHCTQGKDRTGIASALILAALGVDRETIIKDFDVTNRVYEKDVIKFSRRVKLLGGKEEEIEVVKSFIGANTHNFIKTLDSIDAQYGSLEAYLKGPMGLTHDDISTLRKRYLTPIERDL